MTNEPELDATDLCSQEFWDARYDSPTAVWSGDPNPHLVEQLKDVAPGNALDVGCGEGADAIWLASRGWNVIGLDVSPVALTRAAARADEAGAGIADRTSWQQTDLRSWEPPVHRFDLVSAHFIHVPSSDRRVLHRRLAAAVRPGGRLLVVGHHPSDLHTSVRRLDFPDLLFTADQIAAELDPDDWDIFVCAEPTREALDPEGKPVTIRDSVLHGVRRG
ncbi:methyltransferase type 12 [Rhodococcus sp. WMMA185]|uniref:class I SAM-dependent methyltransferase n=1 Tax=Rhodococcus sp. WMMA185 TaxID=679318 RepID=UPI0008780627|nr:class I SAM-dependent methyltransferase [Rhodococcus sp. WMMA185]AOW93743.1 methyltransferase type 12 [Rhodococcus sp. WMMA185]